MTKLMLMDDITSFIIMQIEQKGEFILIHQKVEV